MNFYIQIALALVGVAVAAYLGYLGYLYWFGGGGGGGNCGLKVENFDPSTGNGLLVWTDVKTQVYQVKVYNTQDKKTAVFSDSVSAYEADVFYYELSSQCFPSTSGQPKSFIITLNDTCISDVLTLDD